MKYCVLDELKECTECGKCNYCEFDENKICDNCMKCVQSDMEYSSIKIDRIIVDN